MTAPACNGDDGGGGSATGGAGGATGGAGGATGGAGGAAGDAGVPCTMNWTGAVTGTADCTSKSSSKFLGGGPSPTVNWFVAGESTDHKVNFSFTVTKPPTATSYTGATGDDLFCEASVVAKDLTSTWSADSKQAGSGTSCSITLTSVTDDSSGATSTFIAHGTATATLIKQADASQVSLTVTF